MKQTMNTLTQTIIQSWYCQDNTDIVHSVTTMHSVVLSCTMPLIYTLAMKRSEDRDRQTHTHTREHTQAQT